MLRINPFLMTLLLASASYGACQQDAAEIGDIGPESQQVCQMLEGRFPESSSVIIDRQIHSGSNISILVTVNGHSALLAYHLVGPDWTLKEPAFTHNR